MQKTRYPIRFKANAEMVFPIPTKKLSDWFPDYRPEDPCGVYVEIEGGPPLLVQAVTENGRAWVLSPQMGQLVPVDP
jgi:hypothetical protein